MKTKCCGKEVNEAVHTEQEYSDVFGVLDYYYCSGCGRELTETEAKELEGEQDE